MSNENKIAADTITPTKCWWEQQYTLDWGPIDPQVVPNTLKAEDIINGTITVTPAAEVMLDSFRGSVSFSSSTAQDEKIRQLEAKVNQLETDKRTLSLTLSTERTLRMAQNANHVSEIEKYDEYRAAMTELLFALTVDLEAGVIAGGTSEAAKKAWDKLLPIASEGDLEKLTDRLKLSLQVLRG